MFGEVALRRLRCPAEGRHLALHDAQQDAVGARLPVRRRRPATSPPRAVRPATSTSSSTTTTGTPTATRTPTSCRPSSATTTAAASASSSRPTTRRRDAELLRRDQLAHELMYFSRGNPVVYYGDEQGFTGTGGDQLARQTMFASQVPDYLDDDLIGTTATHAQDNFVPSHPLYQTISGPRGADRGAPGAARRRAAEPVRERRARGSTRSRGWTARTSASTSSR